MKRPLSHNLLADPRIAQARALLSAAVRDHAARITGPRPADPSLTIDYAALLKDFADARAGSLYYPYLGSGLGNGPLVELADGSVKYDLITGVGVHYFGHSHEALSDLAFVAAVQDTVMQGNLQQNTESARLARDLIRLASPGSRINHCFLTTSGAMANENALKLLFHKRPGTDRLLAFEHTFAGRTMALAQVTDKPAYRVGLPEILNVDYIPFFDPADPEGSTRRAVQAAKEHIARHPGRHAGIWMELVLGEGGFYPGNHRFFTSLLEPIRESGLGVVADEVQSFGRTPKPFAFQYFGLERQVDIVTVGKLLQVCATLFADSHKPGPGLVSQTFTGATSSIHAARWIVGELGKPYLFNDDGRNATVHGWFVRGLKEIQDRHPGWIRGPFGIGGMVAFEPFDGSDATCKSLLSRLFDAGVIGFYCGSTPARIRFLPPVPVIREEHVREIMTILETCLAGMARERS